MWLKLTEFWRRAKTRASWACEQRRASVRQRTRQLFREPLLPINERQSCLNALWKRLPDHLGISRTKILPDPAQEFGIGDCHGSLAPIRSVVHLHLLIRSHL